jgi:hypothetical protein
MYKIIKPTIITLLLIYTSSVLCYGQGKREDSLLLNRYSNLKYVIEDLPFFVETDNDLNFYLSDLVIVQRADSLLSDTARWNRNDDRNCGDDIAAGKYSLFCALYKASLDFAGEYLHRRTVMQEVRFIIGKYYRSRFNRHRLMDFNNNPKTTIEDVRDVLAKSEKTIREQLDAKQEILEIIHKVLDDTNRHNTPAIKNLFAKNATHYFLMEANDSLVSGEQTPFIFSKEGIQDIRKKMNGKAFVKVAGNIGTAWVPYQVSGGQKSLYHGTGVFNLVRSKNEWEITSVNYTVQNN